MDYKILQIDSGALKKVNVGAKPNPDTILSTPKPNTDLSHTEEYYLIVSVLVEYAGEQGTVVDDTTFKVMTATFDKDNLCTGVEVTDLPTAEDIITAAEEKAEKFVKSIDYRDYVNSVVELTRNTIDTYDLPKERYLKPGLGID